MDGLCVAAESRDSGSVQRGDGCRLTQQGFHCRLAGLPTTGSRHHPEH